MANFKEISEAFISGATDGKSSGQGNLKIQGDQLIHYSTPILERYGDLFILNMTRYSLVTGRLQKQLTEMIPSEKLIRITHIPEGYKGLLHNAKEASDGTGKEGCEVTEHPHIAGGQ